MDKKFKIDTKTIGGNSPVYIIAEAGVNHNGNYDLACKLVDVAVSAGADAVKFQSYMTEEIIIEGVEKAGYQKQTTSESESQKMMLKALEIDKKFHISLIKYCKEKGVTFLSTPYDLKSLKMLEDLDVSAIKVAATDATNVLFLEEVAKLGKPVILSIGMCDLEEAQLAYDVLRNSKVSDLAILKCTSNYPTSIDEVNLKAIKTLENNFDCVIGFSDHTAGVGASPYAVSLGAKIIEKHITLDKSMEGPDHKASLDPEELKELVKEVRRVESMLGSENIAVAKCEVENKLSLQKNIVARCDIKSGEVITRDNITAKRTGGIGIKASEAISLLGLKAKKNFIKDELLHIGDIK